MLNCYIIIKCKHQAKFDKKIKIKYDKFANNSFYIKNLKEIKLKSFHLNCYNVILFKHNKFFACATFYPCLSTVIYLRKNVRDKPFDKLICQTT